VGTLERFLQPTGSEIIDGQPDPSFPLFFFLLDLPGITKEVTLFRLTKSLVLLNECFSYENGQLLELQLNDWTLNIALK
jgi:hypothetical protein